MKEDIIIQVKMMLQEQVIEVVSEMKTRIKNPTKDVFQ